MASRKILLSLAGALGFAVAACQTASSSNSEGAEDGGYFVALAGKAPEMLPLYDALYAAVDAYNRRSAETPEARDRYIERFEADGYARLSDQTSEIECDRDKCLVKLAARHLVGKAGGGALAEMLTTALQQKGPPPRLSGTAQTPIKTYVLGQRPGPSLVCRQRGHAGAALFTCDFDLDKGRTASNAAADAVAGVGGKGKLVDCALAPGISRAAVEARSEVDGGGLLKLASGAGDGARPVGFLRYVHQGASVEFLDLYLCGDISHDTFQVDGDARQPRAWVRRGVALESVHEDEAHLEATTAVVDDSSQLVTVEVRFRLRADAAGEGYGEDKFYLKVDKAWLR